MKKITQKLTFLFSYRNLFLTILFPVFAFAQTNNDAGISNIIQPTNNPGMYANVQVVLNNYGTAPLTSAVVNWTVNGTLQTPYVLNNFYLAQGQSYNLYIGGYSFMASENYTVVAYTTNPNGNSDENPSNDTYSVSLQGSGGSGGGNQGLDAGITAFVDPQTPSNNNSLVQVTLSNLGSVPLNTVEINWTMNGELQAPYFYIGPTLQSGQSIDLYIGAYNFNANATYTIEAFTSNPNGGIDQNNSNNQTTFVLNGLLDLFDLDAGILAILQPENPSNGYKLIRVRLKNFGEAPLETVTINWKVNGVAQTPYQYIGPTLNSREEIDLYIGSYLFSTNESYFITSSTANPNGGTDQHTINNTANISF